MSSAMSTMSAASSRSGYVSYLRRAFLLRAHPDRFRKHSQDVVKSQAAIIQVLADRLTAPDFSAYVANKQITPIEQKWKSQTYYLERKNGELVQHTLPLNDNVEGLLSSLSEALRTTGLKTMKGPPPSAPTINIDNFGNNMKGMKNYHNEELNKVVNGRFWSDGNTPGGNINTNHAFDINTSRGRSFLNFIMNLDTEDIEQRKADRIDASAAALVARQAFKFQSINGTGLGWSSSSLAICLNTLTKVFDEHNGKFKVDSFYPLQLILSNDEFQSKVDLYGGKIMLNPGSTQIQWLETLMSVTEETLSILEKNRDQLNENLLHVQNSLNVRLVKGFSCSSEEYFLSLKELAGVLNYPDQEDQSQSNTKALALDRVVVVIETHQACRRIVVTKTGEIRISASMSPDTILSSLSKLRNDAWQNTVQEKEKKKKAKELITMLKHEFGLIKVYKNPLSIVSTDQFVHSLSNILSSGDEAKQTMKEFLAGKSLGITSSGRLCHLADDGSLLIPWDWR